MTSRMEGRVRDGRGRPVAGAMVMVVSGTAPTPEIAQRSGADGRFRLALPDGRFRVEAHHPELGTASREIATGRDAAPIDLSFEANAG